MLYYQCRLEKNTDDGIATTVAWIEEKGAKEGAKVQLIGESGLWNVKVVTKPGRRRIEIDNQKSRMGLASI